MALTLELVEQAIADVILLGQSTVIDGHTVTRADLDRLEALRDKLLAESAPSLLDRSVSLCPRRGR